ncbi:phosphate/phosphite/phosphonate ABC transporter substrate-binding protein [Halostella litorea]|uniref:phosphate/phosphite/phosphonate ABC transporter substrate-binding protein n=1 Tax=Halostella litorea TaxID=2528831 RepID=UPI001091A88B|nr:phosphate/phosphite/phosphonate ABC transporter substrate-binding protein [Halostella litorea]
MTDRRNFLKGVGAAGTVAFSAGCIGDLTGGSGSDSSTITFSLTPAESDVDVQAQYKPMFDYLEDEADVTIESSVAADYAAVLQALDSDQTDVADAAPAIALQAGNQDIAEVAGIRIAYGAARYFSLITTLPDNDIDELADVEGETVAFADSLSTSGSLFPLYMLNEAGLDTGNAPNGDAEDFTGQWSDHSTARETLINRDPVVAAGTGAFSTAANVPADQFPDQFMDMSAEADGAGSATDEQELQLLSCSDPIPRAPILVRSGLDDDVKGRVVDALLAAEEDDLIDEDADEELWFTGLSEGSVDDYQPVQNVIDTLGVELGQ